MLMSRLNSLFELPARCELPGRFGGFLAHAEVRLGSEKLFWSLEKSRYVMTKSSLQGSLLETCRVGVVVARLTRMLCHKDEKVTRSIRVRGMVQGL